MIRKIMILVALIIVGAMCLTACGSAATQIPPTEPLAAVIVTDVPTEANTEIPTDAPTQELTTLIARNPTAVASGDTPQEVVIAANIDAADVAKGERLFNTALVPACVECHVDDASTRQRGPSLANFSDVAGTRISGQDAYTYAYNSIRYANDYIVDGYEADVMRVYDGILTDQEVYELIAYIWTLGED